MIKCITQSKLRGSQCVGNKDQFERSDIIETVFFFLYTKFYNVQ